MKEKKFLQRLLKGSRKPDYYIPEKHDLQEEFEKYKRQVESHIQESTAFFRLGRLYHHKGEINLAIENYHRALELKPTDAYTHYNLGNAYFKDGRFDEALVQFNKALELDSQDVYTCNALANTYLRLGKYDEALNNHRKALRLSSRDTYAFKGMGDVYMHLGNYEEAMTYYEKALESKPDFAIVYYNMGVLYGKLDDYDKSVENLLKAIELDKSKAIFYLELGNACRELKDLSKALENYDKAVEIEPKLKDAYCSIMTLLCQQGKYEEAFQRAHSLTDYYPSEGWPFGILGLACFLKREYQDAIFYYGMAIDYEPEDPSLYSGLGDIYYQQYDLIKAGNMYETAIKLSPTVWAYKQLAGIYQEQGLWNFAERNYNEALRLAPGFYEVYVELGKFYALTGKLELALSTFDKALLLNSSLIPVCALEKGIIFMRKGDENKGKEEFQKGINILEDRLKSEGDHYQDYLQLGLFYRELKDYNKVIEVLNKALLVKETSEIYYHLGYAFQQSAQLEKAIENYKKSVELNPRFCSSYECLGIINLNEQKYNEAEEYFNRILEINPRHLYANYHLARVYEGRGDYEKAREEYSLALKVSDFNHKAHHGLAALYSKTGEYKKSIKHYEKAIDLNPGEPLYYSDLGDLYKKKGMNKEAAQAYQKAMKYCTPETLKHPYYENLYSLMMWRHLNASQALSLQKEPSEIPEQQDEGKEVYSFIPVAPLMIELGRDLLPLIDPNLGAELLESLASVRRHIALELGFVVPRVRFRDNSLIEKSEYILKVQEVEAARGEVKPDKLLATHKPEFLDILKGEKCKDPVYGGPAVWIKKSERYSAQKTGFMIFDPSTVVTMHLGEVIRSHVDELFGLHETHHLIETIKKINPVVVSEIYPEKFSLSFIHLILSNLLKERVSIRNLVSIFETLAAYSHIEDTDRLTNYVRKALRKTICRDLNHPPGELHAFTLSSDAEKIILRLFKNKKPAKAYESFKDLIKPLFDEINIKLEEIREKGFLQMALVCSSEARFPVRRFVGREFPHLVILSSEEIDPELQFKDLGEIGLSQSQLQKIELKLSTDSEDIIKVLANSLKEGSLEVKISALKNIVKINREKSLNYIMYALKSEHPELQIEAQNMLGEIWRQ